MKTERIHGLDTLRATAIALVLLQHYVVYVDRKAPFSVAGAIGWIGVDLFFALSGYLIGNQIFAAMRSEAGFSLRRFYGRRFLRTLPAFYAVLALYALWPAFRAGAELPPVWRFLTFTQNIALDPGTAFSHAWSLNIEEQFYMVLPAAALLLAALRAPLSRAWMLLAMVVAFGLAARAWLWLELVDGATRPIYHYYKYIYYSTLCRLDGLVAGVAIALLKNYHVHAWERVTRRGNALALAGLAACVLAAMLFLDDPYGLAATVAVFPLLALGFGLLVLAAVSRDSLLRTLRIPGAASLALWSYAIYLAHKQALILIGPNLARLGVEPGSLPAFALAMGAAVLAGVLLYVLVEAPFMRLRDRLMPDNAPR